MFSFTQQFNIQPTPMSDQPCISSLITGSLATMDFNQFRLSQGRELYNMDTEHKYPTHIPDYAWITYLSRISSVTVNQDFKAFKLSQRRELHNMDPKQISNPYPMNK